MSIQTRFLLALGLLLVASLVTLSLAVFTYTVPRVVQWETREAAGEIDRVHRALEREFQHLLIYTREWSVWDDTYRFVMTPGPEFIDANLGASNFIAAQVDLLVFLRSDGEVVWSGFMSGSDVDRAAGARLAEEILPQLPMEQWMKPGSRGHGGLMPTRHGLMAVAVHPVFISLGLGAPAGAMIAGRSVDAEFMQQLRAQTDLDLDVAPAADAARLAGGANQPVDLPEDGQPLIRIVSPARLQLLARIRDLAGKPSVAIRINISREVFSEGRRIMIYSLTGALLLFLLTMIIAWFLLRRMVFTPVADLARRTSELHRDEEMTRRSLDISRNDEIGDVAREFDTLLQRITQQSDDLRRLSIEDALTGVRNRRYFDQQLRSSWAVLQRTNQPLSLLILDVDDFKRFNDRYGHQMGDMALRAVAQATRQVLRRAVDTVARYGGEEFAAILPGTSGEDAAALAEKVREAVLSLVIPHESSQAGPFLSVSIGVASVDPATGLTVQEILELADRALYAAKRSGRNRVVAAPEPERIRPVNPASEQVRAG
jgi:diguanylate cyclase (GGDEF)-like protein